jgi:hypothetical protein
MIAHTLWRVGRHYAIHVYEGERPVATFHTVIDARLGAAAPALADALEAWAKSITAHLGGDPINPRELDALRINTEAALRAAGRLP